MTTKPARRTSPCDDRPAAGRVLVALATIVTAITVGLLSLFAMPASASPLTNPQNGVGVMAHAGGQRVGPHEDIPAGQGRARAPNYDSSVVGSGVGAETEAASAAGAASTEPTAGQTIYRVYGGDSAAGGASWSPVNPGDVTDFRDAAGLPSGGASGATNTGQFVIEGTLNDPDAVVLLRNALALDGMKSGLPEYIIPNWMENGSITVNRVSGVNPEF